LGWRFQQHLRGQCGEGTGNVGLKSTGAKTNPGRVLEVNDAGQDKKRATVGERVQTAKAETFRGTG